jgi:hypothetical protein
LKDPNSQQGLDDSIGHRGPVVIPEKISSLSNLENILDD